MRKAAVRGFRFPTLLAATFVLAALAGPADAHRLKLFATADETTITGYVYFAGGGRVADATVSITDPTGATLGEAQTNADGEFTFRARHQCDHILTVQTADGHRAEWTVKSGELSPRLPRRNGGRQSLASDARDTSAPMPPADVPPDVSAIEAAIAETVREQIAPLRGQIQEYREEIQQYEEKVRFHDILGGIGYLVGLAGLAFYFLGARRKAPGGSPPAPLEDNSTPRPKQS